MTLLKKIADLFVFLFSIIVMAIADFLSFTWYEKLLYSLFVIQAIIYGHTGALSSFLDSTVPAFINTHQEYTYRTTLWFICMVLICTTAVFGHFKKTNSFFSLAFVFVGVGVFIDQLSGAFITAIPTVWIWVVLSFIYSYITIKIIKK